MNNRPWQPFQPFPTTPPTNSQQTVDGGQGREGPPLLATEDELRLEHDPRRDRGEAAALPSHPQVDGVQLYLQVQSIDTRLSNLETHVYTNLQPRLQEALAEASAATAAVGGVGAGAGGGLEVGRVGRRPLSSLPGRAPTVVIPL